MYQEQLKLLIAENYGILPDYPFENDFETAVFRHTLNKKWFAIIMNVEKSKLAISGDGTINIVNFKCDEEVIYSMVQEGGIYPAYHMNKRHWISVALDGSVDFETVKWLLDISFNLTESKRK